MAQNVKISSVLNRKLKDGKEYDKLMPRVSCTTTPLGDGDTFFTVDRMKDWIEKFSYQTEKIALQLKGRTVEETANNIYNFLYNHVQYKADGQLQQLRSPACTWAQRKEGVDCKSYSVFASSILSNLGITHAIRQVRQAYYYPDEFTHVYVVVYKDQSRKEHNSNAPTFLIDATKHENTEVNYLEKIDIQMGNLKHVGLNAPQDERATNISRNFERFSAFLLAKGASISEVNLIRKNINQYTRKGIDPKINIVSDGLEIQGVTYPVELTEYVSFPEVKKAFYDNYSGLKGVGLGFSFGDVFSKIGDFEKQTRTSGSGSSGGGFVSNIFSGSSKPATQPGGGGVGNIVDSVGKNFPFGALIGSFLENFNVVDNINNAFKYGLNSWGASTSPEQMSGNFSQKVLPYLKNKLETITANNVDDQIDELETVMRINRTYHQYRVGKSRATSSKKGHAQAASEYGKLLNTLLPKLIKMFEEKGVKVQKKVWNVDLKSLKSIPYVADAGQPFTHIENWGVNPTLYKYDFDFSNYQGNNTVNTIPSGNVQTGSFGGGSPQKNINPNTIQAKPAGSNTGLIIGGIALASLPFLLPMIKGGNPAAKAPVKKAAAKRVPAKKTKK